jgi:hypothetical protein
MEVFFLAILSPQLDMGVKRHLFLVFETLLTIYQVQEADKGRAEEFYTQLLIQVQGQFSQTNLSGEVTKGGLLILQAVLVSLRDSRFLTKVFPVLATLLCKLADEQIGMIGGLITQMNASSLTVESPAVEEALGLLDVLYEWCVMHVNLLERWESKKHFGFSLMSQSQPYANTIAKLLSISFPLGRQTALPESARLISVTGIAKLDNLINKVKHRCHEYLNQIYTYLFEKVHTSIAK